MSGELQRLAAQAEVSPIFRTHGGLVQSREGKELQRDLRDLGHRGVLAKAEVAVHTEITQDAMDSVTEVDQYRRTLAGNDELLNQALAQVEVNHLKAIGHIQKRLDGGLI